MDSLQRRSPRLSRRRLVRFGIAGLGAGLALPLLSACGAPAVPPTATPAPAKPAAAAPTTAPAAAPKPAAPAAAKPASKPAAGGKIQFFSVESVPEQNVLKPQLEIFEKNTGLQVEFAIVTGNVAFNQKLQTMVAGGVPPDVHYVDFRNFARWAFEGQLLHLDPLIKRDKYDVEDFHPKFLEQCIWDGKIFSFGRAFGWRQLFYNVDMFEEAKVPLPTDDWLAPNWTFDEFADATEKLTKRDNSGRVQVWGFAGNTAYSPWLYSNGGRMIDEKNERAMIYEPPATRAIEFLADLIHKRKSAQTLEASKELGAVQTFMAGRAAIIHGATITTNQLRQIKDFNWNTTVMPRGWDLQGERRNHGGGGGWAASSGAKDTDRAWELLAFLCGKETQTVLARAGTPPYRRSILYSNDWLDPSKPPKAKKVMSDGANHIVANPQLLTWNEFEPAMGRILENVWLGKQTVQEVLPTMKEKADDLVAKHKAELAKRTS